MISAAELNDQYKAKKKQFIEKSHEDATLMALSYAIAEEYNPGMLDYLTWLYGEE